MKNKIDNHKIKSSYIFFTILGVALKLVEIGSNLTLENLEFSDSSSNGGILFIISCNLTANNLNFNQNSVSKMVILNDSFGTFSNSILHDNFVDSGGILMDFSTIQFTNFTLLRNENINPIGGFVSLSNSIGNFSNFDVLDNNCKFTFVSAIESIQNWDSSIFR